MGENKIQDNPSLKDLQKNADNFKLLRKAWPFLRPLARILGAKVTKIEQSLENVKQIERKVYEMIVIPDKFNDIFSSRGWIIFDSMELDVAKEAIHIFENDGIEVADEFLTNHFSPEWIEKSKYLLKHAKGFDTRFSLAMKALEDYKASRYYSSALVVLTLIDGWVNDLNIMGFRRYGFFSEESSLVAWDSIAAHPKGLVKLKEVFNRSRQMTRTKEITIPFRNGIIHGMDLGYDNKYVAAKCWAALFAVRDWAVKVAKNEIDPPTLEPKIEKTLWESIEDYQKLQKEIEAFHQWKPREIIIGTTIPRTGAVQDYPVNTPESKLVEFTSYWKKKNYGYMANCFTPMIEMHPTSVRERFSNQILVDFEIMESKDIMPYITDIVLKVNLRIEDVLAEYFYEFRLVCTKEDGEFVTIPDEDSIWGISTWSKRG